MKWKFILSLISIIAANAIKITQNKVDDSKNNKINNIRRKSQGIGF